MRLLLPANWDDKRLAVSKIKPGSKKAKGGRNGFTQYDLLLDDEDETEIKGVDMKMIKQFAGGSDLISKYKNK